MGRRKLRFDLRKNHERKKYGLRVKIPLQVLKPPHLMVQLPISAYTSATAPDPTILRSRLGKSNLLPSGWTVAEEGSQPMPGVCPPLVLYRLQVLQVLAAPCVPFTLSVDGQFTWTLRLGTSGINSESCHLLRGYALTLSIVDEVVQLLSRIEESAFCVGNADARFTELVDSHKGTFKDPSGRHLFQCISPILITTDMYMYPFLTGTRVVASYDSRALPVPTIRHSECALVVAKEGSLRCQKCTDYRRTLNGMASRVCLSKSAERTAPSSHTNYRYLSSPEKVDRLRQLHQ